MAATAAKIARSSLWLTSSFLVGKLSRVLAQIVLARLLIPEDFGVWGMVLVVTALSSIFKDSAISGVLIQRGIDDKTLVNAVYSLGIAISVVMFFLQSAIGFPLALFFDTPIVFPLTVVSALTFLIGAGAGTHGAILQRQMKFHQIAIARWISNGVRLITIILAAVLGAGVWSFVLAELAFTAISSVLRRLFSGYHCRFQLRPDAGALCSVRRYVGSLIGTNLAVYANTNSDNMIIGRLLGAQSLGLYNLAYQLAMMPTFVLSQVNRVSFSVMSQLSSQALQRYVSRSLELFAIVSAPIYGVAYALAPLAIPWIYGPEWKPVVGLFQWVLVFAYARGFMAILGTTLNAIDRPELNAFINWAMVPMSLPAFAIGAWLGGIQGVAISVAIVMGLGATAWFWLATCRAAKWSAIALIKPLGVPTVAIGLSLACSFVVVTVTPIPQWSLSVLVLAGYLGIASVLSGGQVFEVFKETLLKSLNVSTKQTAEQNHSKRTVV
ncbi:MAG: lipopolysaccharide biosynthesis protein [Synechococcus sp.]